MKKIIFMLYLVFSLVLVVPFSTSFVFAEPNPIKAKPVGEIQQNCGGPVNVRDSLVLSVVSMCLPGILEKTHEWRQNKCQKAVCYYEAVSNELDPSFCIEQDAYKTCTFIVGEVFAMPPLAILDYYRQAMANLLANPIGLAWSTGAKLGREKLSKCTSTACKPLVLGPTALFLFATDALAIAQTIMDIMENGFFPPGIEDDRNYCEQLPEIKEEMERILQFANA